MGDLIHYYYKCSRKGSHINHFCFEHYIYCFVTLTNSLKITIKFHNVSKALAYVIQYRNCLNVVKQLLHHGAYPNYQVNTTMGSISIFKLACIYQQPQYVECFLDHGIWLRGTTLGSTGLGKSLTPMLDQYFETLTKYKERFQRFTHIEPTLHYYVNQDKILLLLLDMKFNHNSSFNYDILVFRIIPYMFRADSWQCEPLW